MAYLSDSSHGNSWMLVIYYLNKVQLQLTVIFTNCIEVPVFVREHKFPEAGYTTNDDDYNN